MTKKVTVPTWNKSDAYKELTKEEQLYLKTGWAIHLMMNTPKFIKANPIHTINIRKSALDTLIVLKANSGEGPQIGFTASSEPNKALRKALSQWLNNEIKWKLDEWQIAKFDEEKEDW